MNKSNNIKYYFPPENTNFNENKNFLGSLAHKENTA